MPEPFWPQFEERTKGGSRPAVLDAAALDAALFLPDDGMELAARLFAEGDLSVNIGGRLRQNPVLLTPPSKPDKYAEFVDRLAAVNDSDTITFTRDYCLKHSPRLARRIRSFVHKFVVTRGIPLPGVNAVFIGGRYRATWIGLHNDFCDTFLVPAIGAKNMLIWEPSYFTDTPLIEAPALNGVCYGHVAIDPYRDDAQIYSAGPGQILFIPARWWHYNEMTTPELTMGLSIGVFNNAPSREIVMRAVSASLAIQEPTQQRRPLLPTPAGILSGSLEEVTVDEDSDAILMQARNILRVQTLIACSSNGVLGCGPYRVAPDEVSHLRLVGNEDSPVYLVADGTPSLLIAGGAARPVKDTPAMRLLVHRLERRVAFLAEDLRRAAPNDEKIPEILSWLYSLGCLELQRGSS